MSLLCNPGSRIPNTGVFTENLYCGSVEATRISGKNTKNSFFVCVSIWASNLDRLTRLRSAVNLGNVFGHIAQNWIERFWRQQLAGADESAMKNKNNAIPGKPLI